MRLVEQEDLRIPHNQVEAMTMSDKIVVLRDGKIEQTGALSNLDAELRVRMRAEIRELHNRLGATTIYVTHDGLWGTYRQWQELGAGVCRVSAPP